MVKEFIPEIVKLMRPEKGKKIKPLVESFRQLTFRQSISDEEIEIICRETTDSNTSLGGEYD